MILASFKEKARYNFQFPLRYAADALRSSLTRRGAETCRILIASDNLALTSEEQFAPLTTNRGRVFDELGVIFDIKLIDEVLAAGKPRSTSYDAVLAKVSFLVPEAEAIEKIARLRSYFPHPVKLIYFDGDDDSCVLWPTLLDLADLYVKKHVFSDLSWYRRSFEGKSNLTDYVARTTGRSFADADIPRSGVVPEDRQDKIVLGYNIGMDDKITRLFRDTAPAPPAEKTVDVMCRAACTPNLWIYPLRNPVAAALAPLEAKGYKLLVPNQRVDQQGYYQEMRGSRICVSPFGYGELCWRDFETVLMGCLLVKPDMSHIRTEPNIFIAGETYAPVKWDMSDLADVCAYYLEHDAERNAITARAYKVLSDYYSSFEFLNSFRNILTQAGVRPFHQPAGEPAANLTASRS